jgi:hypothetical protein
MPCCFEHFHGPASNSFPHAIALTIYKPHQQNQPAITIAMSSVPASLESLRDNTMMYKTPPFDEPQPMLMRIGPPATAPILHCYVFLAKSETEPTHLPSEAILSTVVGPANVCNSPFYPMISTRQKAPSPLAVPSTTTLRHHHDAHAHLVSSVARRHLRPRTSSSA